MKKQYINPSMEIVELKMEGQLLAGSTNLQSKDGQAVEWGAPMLPGLDDEDEE